MKYTIYIKFLIILIISFIIIRLVYKPNFLINYFKKSYFQDQGISFINDKEIITTIKYKNFKGNIYRIPANFESVSLNPTLLCFKEYCTPSEKSFSPPIYPKNKKLSDDIILYIHGGGFIWGKATPTSEFLIKLAYKSKCDIYTFDYPEHLTYNQSFCLEYMKLIIDYFKKNFKKYNILSDSAGSWYCQYFIENKIIQEDNIEKVIYLHPFLGTTNNTLLDSLFKIYMLRKNVSNINLFSLKRPLFIISSIYDPFYNTIKKLKLNKDSILKIYDCYFCFHDFMFSLPNMDQSIDVINEIINFLNK